MRNIWRTWSTILGVFLIVSLLLGTLTGCGETGKTAGNTSGKITPVSNVDTRGQKGDITTGEKVEAISQTIPASGGTIADSNPEYPLNGLQIDVPANAYYWNQIVQGLLCPDRKKHLW